MSCRRWLHSVAVGGCLTLLLGFLLACYSEAQPNPDSTAEQTTQQAQPADQSRPLPAAESRQPVVIPENQKPKGTVYKSACGETEDHNEADLCEQRRMAKAAVDAVWWASAQTALGIFGFAAVICSLFFTGWAAVAAGRAAKAATDAVTTARNAERPYLTPVNVRIKGLEFGLSNSEGTNCIVQVFFDFVNYGRGPGFLKNVETAAQIAWNVGALTKKPEGPHDWAGREVVMPDYQKPKTWPVPFTVFDVSEAERKSLLANDKSLFVWGVAIYFDLYKITRRSGFLFEYWPGKDGEPGAFIPTGPNSYWFDEEVKGGA